MHTRWHIRLFQLVILGAPKWLTTAIEPKNLKPVVTVLVVLFYFNTVRIVNIFNMNEMFKFNVNYNELQ